MTRGSPQEADERSPVLFISHGSPNVALDDDDYAAALRNFAARIPTPRAIAVVSAHWQKPAPLRVTSSPRPPLIYDFDGFPPQLYALDYPCPGAPDLAAQIAALLTANGSAAVLDPARGLDHGAWIPLRIAFPEAGVPVVEISLPRGAPPQQILAIGTALSPLRAQGVLLVGSGGIVHNLLRLRFDSERTPADAWAHDFDDWVRARLGEGDLPALLSYRNAGPHAELAVPTTEHFDPLFFVLGAAALDEGVTDVYTGIRYGNLSMRSFALGWHGR